MLYMYIHTHPLEKCVIQKPEEARNMLAKAQEGANKAGIKILGGYMAPHEHTMYMVFDAPDIENVTTPPASVGDPLVPVTNHFDDDNEPSLKSSINGNVFVPLLYADAPVFP